MTVLDKPLALVPVEERSETESESADESAARPTTPVRGAMPVAALVERADAAQRPADRDVLDYASDDSEVEKLEPPRAWPRSDECTLLRPFVCARQDFGVQQDAAQRPPDSDGTESESSEDEEPRPTPPPKKRSRPAAQPCTHPVPHGARVQGPAPYRARDHARRPAVAHRTHEARHRRRQLPGEVRSFRYGSGDEGPARLGPPFPPPARFGRPTGLPE